ncbi:MAG: hypothetical protein AAF748_09930 [Pseudomonadota bacterium]
MPLDRLVLLVVLALGAALAVVWVSAVAIAALQIPYGWLAAIPAIFAGYVVWRVVADRLNSAEDSYYDNIEK